MLFLEKLIETIVRIRYIYSFKFYFERIFENYAWNGIPCSQIPMYKYYKSFNCLRYFQKEKGPVLNNISKNFMLSKENITSLRTIWLFVPSFWKRVPGVSYILQKNFYFMCSLCTVLSSMKSNIDDKTPKYSDECYDLKKDSETNITH